jgi:uncharacterized protein YutE (UPF0331/DUF86 family)
VAAAAVAIAMVATEMVEDIETVVIEMVEDIEEAVVDAMAIIGEMDEEEDVEETVGGGVTIEKTSHSLKHAIRIRCRLQQGLWNINSKRIHPCRRKRKQNVCPTVQL